MKEESCRRCRYFSELTEPRTFENHTVYGLCFDDTDEGWAVFDPEGSCDDYEWKLNGGGTST